MKLLVTGKTVLLNEFERNAKLRGWHVYSDTATEGFLDRLEKMLLRDLNNLRGNESSKLTGINIAGSGIEFSPSRGRRDVDSDFLWALSQICDAKEERDHQAGQHPTGVLITLDELHHLRREEIVAFAVAIQHMVREDREIAVTMAGIPSAVKPLLASDNDDSQITFIRRANRIELGRISEEDVQQGLQEPVEEVGGRWAEDALLHAVKACGGYPFMVQLVGHYAFRRAVNDTINLEAARYGSSYGKRKLGQLVHAPSLDDLSDVNRTFLMHMAADDGPSSISELAAKMRVSAQYAQNYRQRLIESDMIYSPRRGYVDFTLPYLREYLREHPVFEAID